MAFLETMSLQFGAALMLCHTRSLSLVGLSRLTEKMERDMGNHGHVDLVEA